MVKVDLNELKQNELKVDNVQVKMLEMKLDAVKALADDSNKNFSQLSLPETRAFSKAYVFAESGGLENLSDRLKAKGIEKTFDIPELPKYLDELYAHRQRAGRQRVLEYLSALKSLGTTTQEQPPQQSIVNRMMGRLV